MTWTTADIRDLAAAANPAVGAAIRKAADRPRPRVGGDAGVVVKVPIRLVSTPNARLHHHAAAKLARRHREMVTLWLGRELLPALPVVVRLVRVYCPRRRQQRYDNDNLTASAKHARDAIADLYGVSDADPAVIRFGVDQEAGEETALRVTINPVRPTGATGG